MTVARRDYFHAPDAPPANSLIVAVSAVVRDDRGRLLIIRRTDNDEYAIPGGGQEIGETLTEAVVREVSEEAGIDVEVTGLVGVFSDPGHVIAFDDGEVRQEFSICFTARPTGGRLRGSDESREVQWVEPAAIDQLGLHPANRLRIERGLADDSMPYFT
ncbi:MAG TPA: NUDIX domain-containing protein [Jiangellaceae bacterium]